MHQIDSLQKLKHRYNQRNIRIGHRGKVESRNSQPSKDLQLNSAIHPLPLFFFRGAWCPICTKHTQQLIKVYPELKEKGFEMIGVSPDSVESTKANIDKRSIPFPLYSDSELNTTSGFGPAFKVDDATVYCR